MAERLRVSYGDACAVITSRDAAWLADVLEHRGEPRTRRRIEAALAEPEERATVRLDDADAEAVREALDEYAAEISADLNSLLEELAEELDGNERWNDRWPLQY